MINDLAISNNQFDGDMMKYADDTNVSEYIVDHADSSSLQEVTDSIVDWSRRNKFQLNPSKCKNSSFLSKGINQASLQLV